MKMRIAFNTIALIFVSHQFATSMLDTFILHKTPSLFPAYFAMFIACVYGCVLSVIDYLKENKNV